LKIAFILMNFPVTSETFVQRDILSLQRNGNQVDVYTLRYSKFKHKYNNYLQYCRYFFRLRAIFSSLFFWWLYVLRNELKTIDKLKLFVLVPKCLIIADQILREHYDVVHLYWGHYPSLLGLMLKDRDPRLHVSLFLGAYDLAKNLEISKKMAVQADSLWTHAQGNKDKLKRLGYPRADDFTVNYRGLDLGSTSNRVLGWSDRKFDFITVSRLIEGKGIMECLRAALEVKNSGRKFKYLIIGDGPLKKRCANFIRKHKLTDTVVLLGKQPVDVVFDSMGASRYFILLSEKVGECLPNVIKEAMLHECYILSGCSENIDELIVNSSVGLVIERSAHNEITETLKVFLDVNMRPNVSLQRAILRDKFNIEETSNKYLKYWGRYA
jgi:glycosyltransferase involved in cell wall biosynthesis